MFAKPRRQFELLERFDQIYKGARMEMRKAQTRYDRQSSDDRPSRRTGREFEAPELTDEQDRTALRCKSTEEAVELQRKFPGRIVITEMPPITSFK